MSSPETPLPNPRVGVASVVVDANGKVVCGKRLSSHGSGTWQLPGGHLEHGESFFACAERECLEETGLHVRGVKVVTVTNDVFADLGKHYITIFVKCELVGTQAAPKAMEPDKCAAWFWKTWDGLRTAGDEDGSRLFLPLVRLFEQHGNDISRLL